MTVDFRAPVTLGETGLVVSRLGLASGYGAPTESIERAFHEQGINYLWASFLKRGNMARAIRHLAPRHREELCIVLSWPAKGGLLLQNFVERWLKKLNVERVDLVVLQDQRRPQPQKLLDRAEGLKESGKARFVGLSSHERPFLGRIARGEVKATSDFLQVRYNAVHPGAEEDLFPHLPERQRPGVVVFTATCWGKLLNPKLLPAGERPLDPAVCYRFVLSNPAVDVCVTAPSTAAQMADNLKALDEGPLDGDEMARVRRIGGHISAR